MPILHEGATVIAGPTGSTVLSGTWYTIPAHFDRISMQAILTASSVGATAGSTVTFEFTNTTAVTSNAGITGRAVALTCTTDTVSGGGSLISSMVAQWRYVRAHITSLTTSTAGSAGTPSVQAIVNVGRSR